MVLEIVTPEAVLYKGKVSVVTLPGAKGSFQILENHAPIVSLLEKGTLSFRESEAPTICVQERFAQEKGEYTLPIEEGVVEQQENKKAKQQKKKNKVSASLKIMQPTRLAHFRLPITANQ